MLKSKVGFNLWAITYLLFLILYICLFQFTLLWRAFSPNVFNSFIVDVSVDLMLLLSPSLYFSINKLNMYIFFYHSIYHVFRKQRPTENKEAGFLNVNQRFSTRISFDWKRFQKVNNSNCIHVSNDWSLMMILQFPSSDKNIISKFQW